MLRRLEIKNYALIESVDLEFGPGFTTITGETGSGKSIILGALSLLLGTRADSRVAKGAKARVEAYFDEVDPEMKPLFEEKGIDWVEYSDDKGVAHGEITVRREISAEGRSRIFINDSSVTLGTLTAIGPKLIDIHSQTANSKLGSQEEQLKMVDSYSCLEQDLKEYKEHFRKYVNLRHKIKEIRDRIEKSRVNEQFLRFQCEQLDKLKPKRGELAEIERRYEVLSDADEVKERLSGLCGLLGDSDKGLLNGVAEARSMIDRTDFNLFGTEVAKAEIPARMEVIYTELKDIWETMEDMYSSVNTDPDSLGKLSARMQAYYDAMKRFKVGTADELVVFHERLRRELSEIEYGGDELPELENAAKAQAALLREASGRLTENRKAGAETLARKIWEEARNLGLPNLRFEIAVRQGKLTSTGQDTVEFLCAFNRNAELRPISATASGGEMSRLMLSVKAAIADKMRMPTMIFDEVDTGVSGEIAERMGNMMSRMGDRMQVMAITHLPQVASQGVSQLKVYKQDEVEKTVTHVKTLEPEERVGEIAAMISGSEVTEAAIRTARSLLNL